MEPPKPVKGTIAGTFTGWGSGVYAGNRAISVEFIPAGRASKVAMTVPNSSTKSSKPTPVSFVSKIAKSLKIGDGVKIEHLTLSKRTWMTSLTRIPRPVAADDTADVFTFVSSRKARTSAGIRTVVIARRNSRMWTFQLPPDSSAAEPVSQSQSIAVADAVSPSNPGTLSEQIARFVAGDPVALEYDTVNFEFVLKSINWHRMSDSATLTRVGERTIRGVIHKTVFVTTSKKQSLTLVVPTTTSTGANAATLTETLDVIKAGQKVEVTYVQKNRILWLDGVTPS